MVVVRDGGPVDDDDLVADLQAGVALRLERALQVGGRARHHVDDDVLLVAHEAERAVLAAQLHRELLRGRDGRARGRRAAALLAARALAVALGVVLERVGARGLDRVAEEARLAEGEVRAAVERGRVVEVREPALEHEAVGLPRLQHVGQHLALERDAVDLDDAVVEQHVRVAVGDAARWKERIWLYALSSIPSRSAPRSTVTSIADGAKSPTWHSRAARGATSAA